MKSSQKYVHLLLNNSTHFCKMIVNFIQNSSSSFSDEHVFVTTSEKIFDEIKWYNNIILEKQKKNNSISIIKKYSKSCNVIIHGFADYKQILLLPVRICKRICWRTWGHDVFDPSDYTGIKKIAGYILFPFISYKIKRIKIIGVENFIDREAFLQRYTNDNIMDFPYPVHFSLEKRKLVNPKITDAIVNKPFRVLVGHSGFSNDNHIAILNRLKKYMKENIEIFLILSYGDQRYISILRDYIDTHFLECPIKIIDSFLPMDEYNSFLSTIDFFILDGKKSYALGNIEIALKANVLLGLNEYGVISNSFVKNNITFVNNDDLGIIDFQYLLKVRQAALDNPNLIEGLFSYDEIEKKWTKVFSCLCGDIHE